eukprot:504646_1
MGNAVNSCINSNDYPDGRSSQDAPESNYSGRHKYTRPVDRSEHSRPAHSNNAAARPHHHRAAHGRAREDDDQYFKLLFLGAGESGKSTLYKRMQIRFGTGYSEHERARYTPTVFENTLVSMKTLIEQSEVMEPELGCRIQKKKNGSSTLIKTLKQYMNMYEEKLYYSIYK